MKKQAYYFPHFTTQRGDPRLVKLRRLHGWAAYGIYNAILELLREQSSLSYPVEGIEDLAYEWRVKSETISAIVNDFDLFSVVDGQFYSSDLNDSLQNLLDKKELARMAGLISAQRRKEKMEELEKLLKERSTDVQQVLNEQDSNSSTTEQKELSDSSTDVEQTLNEQDSNSSTTEQKELSDSSTDIEQTLNEQDSNSSTTEQKKLSDSSTDVEQTLNGRSTIIEEKRREEKSKEKENKKREENKKPSEHPFSLSPYFDFNVFSSSIDEKYHKYDLAYYHESAKNYSLSKGVRYVDWLAAIRNWMIRDIKDNNPRLRKPTALETVETDADERQKKLLEAYEKLEN
jgi:hypothetical protein